MLMGRDHDSYESFWTHDTFHYIQFLNDPGLRFNFANVCTQNLGQYGQTEFHHFWLSL